ncbi:MAG: hypothetical protein ACRCZ1_01080, partial [Cetobacterium sp.]
ITYSREIKQELDTVDGYVSFHKVKGIDLEFKGNKENEKYEYRLNNLMEPLNMNIVLKNIDVKPELIQYGYDDKNLSGATGQFNMNLTIATSGLQGEAELLNGTVIYDELDETVKDINGKIDFGKEAIKVDFDYSLDKNKGQFKVNYTEKEGVSVDFKFKDLPYFIAEKYKLLGNLNLPLDDYKFKNVDVKLTNNQKNGFEAGVKYKMYPIVNSKIKLENINGDLRFKDGVLNLSAKNIEFLVLDVDYKKEINYDLELNLQNENLKLKLNSNFIDFLGEYKKSDKTLKLYQKSKKAMEYNFEKQNLNFLELEGKNLLNNYKFLLKVKQEKKNLNIEEFSMENSAEEKVVQISGDFDIEKIKYNIKINTQNLKEENLFSDKKLGLKLDFIGELSGEKEKFILRGVVKDFLVQNKDISIKSYGNISFLNSDGLKGEIDGELRLGKY